MATFNYNLITQKLLKNLPERTKEVISRRFSLSQEKGETLEEIGRSFGITRERVRQIELDGFKRMQQERAEYEPVSNYFREVLEGFGGARREDVLIESLGGENSKNHVSFLLNLSNSFIHSSENKDFYSLWAVDRKKADLIPEVTGFFLQELEKASQPIRLVNQANPFGLSEKEADSFLEISKKIQKNTDGLYGLKEWPEINPRGVKDKAFLVLKKENKPLHFSDVAKKIGNALPQTVHNELIKDPRFVLVGRGLYALQSWGYEPGVVKDVISRILKQSNNPLTKEEIISEVLKQRLVKENTIVLNLGDKKLFGRTSDGRYTINEA